MIKSILLVALVILAVLGICDVIHFFRRILFSPTEKPRKMLLVFLSNKQPLLQLRQVYDSFLWHGDEFAENIVAVLDNVDESDWTACREFCSDKFKIFLTERSSISEFLDFEQ